MVSWLAWWCVTRHTFIPECPVVPLLTSLISPLFSFVLYHSPISSLSCSFPPAPPFSLFLLVLFPSLLSPIPLYFPSFPLSPFAHPFFIFSAVGRSLSSVDRSVIQEYDTWRRGGLLCTPFEPLLDRSAFPAFSHREERRSRLTSWIDLAFAHWLLLFIALHCFAIYADAFP